MSKCKARQYSDQKVCHDCRLVWDVNDTDPPKCQQEDRSTVPKPIQKAFFQELRNTLAEKSDDGQ